MTRSSDRSEVDLPSIAQLHALLRDGRVTARELVVDALARADAADGEGARTFTQLHAEEALAAAADSDSRREAGGGATRLAGLPISVKDLFDVAGHVTLAGSRALAGRSPAVADAEVVARLRRAGAAIVGKTNMTEFAFSGVGMNPHYGTPRNPYARDRALIPGGSSSGAAVSVADRMCVAAIGTDTGGSVRIPAALCGLVGFKPTAARVPLSGIVPLSPSLDSVGPIAATVECCTLLDEILSGAPPLPVGGGLQGLNVGVAQALVWDDVDEHVARSISAALSRLSAAGAVVREVALPALAEIPGVNARGGLPAIESYAWHRRLLAQQAADYDPRVRSRIERGRDLGESDYLELVAARRRLTAAMALAVADLDLWCMPTVPCVAPAIAALSEDAAYFESNRLLLRNPSLVNFLDGCAITLPCHERGTAPVGLSFVAGSGADRRLLALASLLAPLVAAA